MRKKSVLRHCLRARIATTGCNRMRRPLSCCASVGSSGIVKKTCVGANEQRHYAGSRVFQVAGTTRRCSKKSRSRAESAYSVRERKAKCRTRSPFAFNDDCSAMRFDEGFAYGQAKTDCLQGFVIGLELFEYMFQPVFRNAGAVVGYFTFNTIIRSSSPG
jgi:hypothetical protein